MAKSKNQLSASELGLVTKSHNAQFSKKNQSSASELGLVSKTHNANVKVKK